MPSPRTSFGQRAMGIASPDYGSYFRQPVVPPMAGYDDPAAEAALSQVNLQAQDVGRQRQQDTFDQLNDFDPEDEESVKGLSRLVALGQVPSGTGNALLRQSRYYNPIGKSNRNTPYSDEGTGFLNDFNSLDWSDPREAQKVVPDLIKKYPTALNDPRVASTLNTFQQHLLSYKAPKQVDQEDWRQTIPSRFANRAALAVQNLGNYSTKLGTEQDIQGGATALQQNIANRNAVHGAIKTLRGYGLSPDQLAEEIAGAGLDPNAWAGDQPPATFEPSDADKEAAIKTHGLVDAAGKPDYHAAYYVAQGLKPPARPLQGASQARSTAILPNVPQEASAPSPQVYEASKLTPEQIGSLPSGTPITMPDGSIKYRK